MTAPYPPSEPEEAVAPAAAEVGVRRRIPFRHIVPNLITILSICAGMTGMRLAFEGRFELAVGMVIGAALLDGIDGRIARLLKGQSRFGAEMDSLADIVNFGVVPGMVLYAHSLREAGSAGWIAALLFAATCALRLARFNTMLDGPKRPEWQSAFFTGVPAPAGAGLAMLPLYLSFTGIDLGSPKATALLSAVYLLVIGFLMASRIPTFSGKTIGVQIRREFVIPVILGLVLYVALLVSFLWETLSATTIAYFIAMIFSVRSFRRHAAADREAARRDDTDGQAVP